MIREKEKVGVVGEAGRKRYTRIKQRKRKQKVRGKNGGKPKSF